ncbi:hypothetical protein VZT92_003309 [Zoarces viviparus]|uniref:Uncharacterized protein n=1 Tax=Zoarces viviparus TaxID=48416 RepID=A0AAW1G147_ZOAVI
MEKPADRTKQVGPNWGRLPFLSDQLASIGFTYEHERWALTIGKHGSTMAMVGLCACSCVPECVRVSGMPKAKCCGRLVGIGQHPQRSACSRRAQCRP